MTEVMPRMFTKFMTEEFTTTSRPMTNDEKEKQMSIRNPPELPPFNGFGTHEDSAINCRTVFPLSATKSYKQFYEKDREGYDSKILRFRAELESNVSIDRVRSFVICYYLSDDTISVFESVEDNSGFSGGMVVSRRKIAKAGEELFGSKAPACYTMQDFYIGSQLELETFKYNIIDADEYAIRYMEIHSNEFPKSNINIVMRKVRDALKPVFKEFVAHHMVNETIPILTLRQFREAIKSLLCENITEHEIITLARYYSSDVMVDPLPNDLLRSVLQTELKRFLFNAMERLEEAFRYRDDKNTGKVSRDAAYSIMRGAKIPVDPEIINLFLDKMCKDEEGKVIYNDILHMLDYRKNPAPSLPPMNVINIVTLVQKFKSSGSSRRVEYVQLEKLLNDTQLEKELVQQSR